MKISAASAIVTTVLLAVAVAGTTYASAAPELSKGTPAALISAAQVTTRPRSVADYIASGSAHRPDFDPGPYPDRDTCEQARARYYNPPNWNVFRSDVDGAAEPRAPDRCPARAVVTTASSPARMLNATGDDVPPVSWSRDTGLQATGWMDGCIVSYSIGVRIPRTEWRRRRLWKISRYSKIAFASSIRVFHRCRFQW